MSRYENKMNKYAKYRKSNFNPEIARIKGYIVESTRGFFGGGYPMRKAIKELREQGYIIEYNRKMDMYYNKGFAALGSKNYSYKTLEKQNKKGN